VDRKTRKDLKSDKFAQELKHGFEFLTEHPEEFKRYGAIAAAVLVIAGAIYFYLRYQSDAREKALAEAIKVENAHVGPAPPGFLTFPTQEEKDKARIKAFTDLVSKYHGSQEAAMAEFYLASNAVDHSNMTEAEKRYKDVADSAPTPYASMAKMALAKIYSSDGRDSEAEKLLRDLVAHPTVTVSKEQAQIQLAIVIGKKNPDEARKLLEPLRTERTAISRAAVQAMGEVAGAH
jgi:predicted negative regulator of RcsB-dependent stress response